MTKLEEYAAQKIIGRAAHDNGFPMSSNPHPVGSEMALMWQQGFISGMDAAMVAKRAVRTA